MHGASDETAYIQARKEVEARQTCRAPATAVVEEYFVSQQPPSIRPKRRVDVDALCTTLSDDSEFVSFRDALHTSLLFDSGRRWGLAGRLHLLPQFGLSPLFLSISSAAHKK